MNGTVKDQPHDLVFFLGKVFRGFWLVRGPFFVALIAALLEYSPPFKELLRIFAEDKFTFLKSQIILGVVSLAIFTGLLWRMSRELFLVSDFLAIYNFRIAKWVRCVIPALVAALPLLGLAVAARSQYAELSELQVVQIEPASATIEPHRAAAETVSSEAIAEASQRAKADFEPSEQAKEAYAREKRAFRPSWAAEIKDLVAPEEGKLSPAENATFDELSRALEETKKSQIAFMYLSLICFAGAALIVIASLAYDFLSGSAHNAQPSEALPWSLRLNWVWLLSMLFCIGLFGFQGAENLHAIDPTRFARWFGTPAIVFLFFTFLVLVVSLATRVFDEHYIPIISLVVLCGLVSAYLERSSNHTVRELERAPPAQPPLYAAFRDWIQQRPGALDATGYAQNFLRSKGSFPVYLFAMEGGGHYASIFASITLAKLFDRCPALRHHIFAISGVSGGGIGAGIFVAALKTALQSNDPWLTSDRCDFTFAVPGIDTGDDRGRLETRIQTFQGADFLSPLAASTLFGDLPQRAIPFSMAALDRARAFEGGLESIAAMSGFRDGQGRLIFEADFLDHWSPAGGTPMLMLNATRVQTGEPIVIAPIAAGFTMPNASELKSLYSDAHLERGLRFSTALGLTARFPYLAPVGTFKTSDTASHIHYDLVDGGYFENSGADALIALLNELNFYKAHPEILNIYPDDATKRQLVTNLLTNVRFKVVVLHQLGDDRHDLDTVFELSAPIDTLYRARQQRTNIAVDRIVALDNVDAQKIIFANSLLKVPLQWQLAPSSINVIRSIVGTPDNCPLQQQNEISRMSQEQKRFARISQALKIIREAYKKTTINEHAAEEVGRMFYYMMHNRCILRDVIETVSFH